jgi:hypothetical protein
MTLAIGPARKEAGAAPSYLQGKIYRTCKEKSTYLQGNPHVPQRKTHRTSKEKLPDQQGTK